MKSIHMPEYFKSLFDRYKYILLVCLVGLVLMLWPQEKPAAKEQASMPVIQEEEHLEARLQGLLEEIDGVGKATVMLTLERGEETEYAYDRNDTENRNENGGSASRQRQLVTVSQGSGQSPIPVWTEAPEYRGAVVVCEGGGSANVRLAVTQVVQSLTGLSADRIVISKMKLK